MNAMPAASLIPVVEAGKYLYCGGAQRVPPDVFAKTWILHGNVSFESDLIERRHVVFATWTCTGRIGRGERGAFSAEGES